MPYYAWQGVNLQACLCKGKQFARNEHELDQFLFKKDIALLHVKPQKLRVQKVKEQEIVNYIIQLHMLIKAGLPLPEALNTIASYPSSAYFSAACHDIADQVQSGISLANALAKHSSIFNPIAIQVIAIGQESGSLPQSLGVLIHYLESVIQFKKKIKAAFLLPTLTFVFFLFMIGIILVVIVPQFVSLCATMQKNIPESTQILLNLSNFLRSFYALITAIVFTLLVVAGRRYKKTAAGGQKISKIVLRISLIKTLITFQVMGLFFRSTAQLLHGGMPLAKALAISAESVEYGPIKERLVYVASAVDAGIPFNKSLHECSGYLDQSMIALICVGQESGKLADMLVRVADEQQDQMLAYMNRITTLTQPILLVVLGLMIGALILGLYAPIMSFSSII